MWPRTLLISSLNWRRRNLLPPVNLATVQIFGLTKTTFRSRCLSAPVTLSPGRSRTVWIMKAMISESSRLSCKRPGAAPLKNEKAGLFCCSQISPLLKNPIKRQKKVTFPFTAMTHGGSEAPVRSEMGGPLMRPVRGVSTREERSYWLTEPALRLRHSVNHQRTLFLVVLFSRGHQWSPGSRNALCRAAALI